MSAATPATRTSTVHLVTIGSFGNAVAKYLRMLGSDIQDLAWPDALPEDPMAWPESETYILSSWKPMTKLCRAVDRMSFDRNKVFLPLVIDASWLRLGPVIVPGISGCWRCWESRQQQHGMLNRETDELLKAYDENISLGPAGFLAPLAMIGAGQIVKTLAARQTPREIAGSIWQRSVFTGQVSRGRLSGVDGCALCGLQRPLEDRTYRALQDELALKAIGASTTNELLK